MKLFFTLFILLTLNAIGASSEVFLDSPPSVKTWKKVNDSYFSVASYDDEKRLSLIKSLLIKECRSKICLDNRSILYSYLYYKDILKKNAPRDYLKNLAELTILQNNVLAKCEGDSECRAETLHSFCNNYEQVSVYPAIFCVSNYLVQVI